MKTTVIFSLALAVFCVLTLPLPVGAQEQYDDVAPKFEAPLSLNQAFTLGDYGGTVWWRSTPIKVDGREFMRLTFTKLGNPQGADADIVIRDRDGAQLQRIALRGADLSQPLVTMRFYVDEITAYVEAPTRPHGLTGTLDEVYGASGVDPKLLSIPTEVPWKPVAAVGAAPAASFARSVVNLLFKSDMKSCTGFIVAADRIMTNRHCIRNSASFRIDQKSCKDVDIQFDYTAQDTPPVTVSCDSASVHPPLDIAVLKVKTAHLATLKGRPIARFADGTGLLPRAVDVLHHPAGLPLQWSSACSIVQRDALQHYEHNCATVGGSSGSPLIDSNGAVVGVQVAGFPSMTLAEYHTAVARGKTFYNKAIDAKRIREAIGEFDK